MPEINSKYPKAREVSFGDFKIGHTYIFSTPNGTWKEECIGKDKFGMQFDFEYGPVTAPFNGGRYWEVEKESCESGQILNLPPILKLSNIEIHDNLIVHNIPHPTEGYFPITVKELLIKSGVEYVVSHNNIMYPFGPTSPYRFYHARSK